MTWLCKLHLLHRVLVMYNQNFIMQRQRRQQQTNIIPEEKNTWVVRGGSGSASIANSACEASLYTASGAKSPVKKSNFDSDKENFASNLGVAWRRRRRQHGARHARPAPAGRNQGRRVALGKRGGLAQSPARLHQRRLRFSWLLTHS